MKRWGPPLKTACMQGDKFTYKELNPVETGLSVRHFALSFNFVYMWYFNIRQINNDNGVGEKSELSPLGDLKLLLFFKYVMGGSLSHFSPQPYPLTSFDV